MEIDPSQYRSFGSGPLHIRELSADIQESEVRPEDTLLIRVQRSNEVGGDDPYGDCCLEDVDETDTAHLLSLSHKDERPVEQQHAEMRIPEEDYSAMKQFLSDDPTKQRITEQEDEEDFQSGYGEEAMMMDEQDACYSNSDLVSSAKVLTPPRPSDPFTANTNNSVDSSHQVQLAMPHQEYGTSVVMTYTPLPMQGRGSEQYRSAATQNNHQTAGVERNVSQIINSSDMRGGGDLTPDLVQATEQFIEARLSSEGAVVEQCEAIELGSNSSQSVQRIPHNIDFVDYQSTSGQQQDLLLTTPQVHHSNSNHCDLGGAGKKGGGSAEATTVRLPLNQGGNSLNPMRQSMVISSNQTLENEIRNMTYTNTMQGQSSEAVLLTDMSPFGGGATTMTTNGHGRQSLTGAGGLHESATDQRSSLKHLLNSDLHRMQSSIDTETLQVMFADSLSGAGLPRQTGAFDSQQKKDQAQEIDFTNTSASRQAEILLQRLQKQQQDQQVEVCSLAEDDFHSLSHRLPDQQVDQSRDTQRVVTFNQKADHDSLRRGQQVDKQSVGDADFNDRDLSVEEGQNSAQKDERSVANSDRKGRSEPPSSQKVAMDEYQIVSASGAYAEGDEPLSILQFSEHQLQTELTPDKAVQQQTIEFLQSSSQPLEALLAGNLSSPIRQRLSHSRDLQSKSDLDQYCQALIDLIAESVPDVRLFLDGEELPGFPTASTPPYEKLLLVIELLISILPSHSKTLQMVRNLQQQMLTSKRDLKQINKSYIQLQADNTLMKTQLKTASTSARLKQAQADLKAAQGQVADLKRQLRRTQRENEQFKRSQGPHSNHKDSPQANNALSAAEYRRLLHEVAFQVYGPQFRGTVDDQRGAQNLRNLLALLPFQVRALRESSDQLSTGPLTGSQTAARTLEAPTMTQGQSQQVWDKDAAIQTRSFEQPSSQLFHGAQATSDFGDGQALMSQSHQAEETLKRQDQRGMSASEMSKTRQIAQALDLDYETVSHAEIIEHIKRNKRLVEQSSQSNRMIAESLKSTVLQKLKGHQSSRSGNQLITQQPFKAVKQGQQNPCQLTQCLSSLDSNEEGNVSVQNLNHQQVLQQPEYQTGKFFNDGSETQVMDSSQTQQYKAREERLVHSQLQQQPVHLCLTEQASQRRRKHLFNNFVVGPHLQQQQQNQTIEPQVAEHLQTTYSAFSDPVIPQTAYQNRTFEATVGRQDDDLDASIGSREPGQSQANQSVGTLSTRPKKSKQPSQSASSHPKQITSVEHLQASQISLNRHQLQKLESTNDQIIGSPATPGSGQATLELQQTSHTPASRLIMSKHSRLIEILQASSAQTPHEQLPQDGPTSIHPLLQLQQQAQSSSQLHQWREMLSPMMKTQKINSEARQGQNSGHAAGTSRSAIANTLGSPAQLLGSNRLAKNSSVARSKGSLERLDNKASSLGATSSISQSKGRSNKAQSRGKTSQAALASAKEHQQLKASPSPRRFKHNKSQTVQHATTAPSKQFGYGGSRKGGRCQMAVAPQKSMSKGGSNQRSSIVSVPASSQQPSGGISVYVNPYGALSHELHHKRPLTTVSAAQTPVSQMMAPRGSTQQTMASYLQTPSRVAQQTRPKSTQLVHCSAKQKSQYASKPLGQQSQMAKPRLNSGSSQKAKKEGVVDQYTGVRAMGQSSDLSLLEDPNLTLMQSFQYN